jgi:Domain of unknown function (DUF3854)/Family of unknown function (DUF5906)
MVVPGFAPADDVPALAAAKLASSGLTVADAKGLGITWLTAAEVTSLDGTFWNLSALRIAYHNPDGTPLSVAPKWPPFYRLRALRAPVPTPEDFRKYLQPPDSGVAAYFPRIRNWPEIISDPRRTIIITEGELKAAKATLSGFPTIGLGGVYSYRAPSIGSDFLAALEAVVWVKRPVVICYDSDLAANSHVAAALNDLAEELTRRGALPRVLFLPPVEGLEKTGLDDWLLNNSTDTLESLIAEADHIGIAKVLYDLNRRYVFVPSLDRVVHRRDGYLSTPTALRTAETSRYPRRIVKANGNVSTERVSAAEAWLSWPMRGDAAGIAYRPGATPRDLVPFEPEDPDDHRSAYNSWTGWGVQPKPGDVSAFLKLVDHLFTGAEPSSKTWFLRWLAYPLRYPGTKLFSSAVIYGRDQGTGKSLLGLTMGRIYGKNFTEIKQADLHSNFNEWAVRKQFILGDDVTGSDKRADLDLLKKMITQKELWINAKNQPTYPIPDVINYIWTSNQPDAFFLEDKDRRFFVHEVTVEPLSRDFYDRYDRLYRGKELPAAIFDYFLTLDLGNFNPHAAAPGTTAKDKMTRTARSDLGNWVRDLISDPDEMLVIGDAPLVGDLFTNRQLLTAYAASVGVAAESIPAKRLWAELARAGVHQVHDGKLIRVGSAGADRYYAVRNLKKWSKASLDDVKRHLEFPDAPPKPKRRR